MIGEISAEELYEQRRYWLEWLQIIDKPFLTLENLVGIIEQKRKKPIKIVPLAIPPQLGSGLVTVADECYLIGIDLTVSSPLKETVLLHELVHIMFGDADRNDFCHRMAAPTEYQASSQVEIFVDEINEKIVEYLAECLAEKISSPERELGGEIYRLFNLKKEES